MNKKGTILDIFYVVIMAFVLVVFLITMWVAHSETNDALQGSKESTGDNVREYNASVDNYTRNTEKYPAFWDVLGMIIIFFSWLAIFISALILDNSSVFYIIYFVLVLVGLIFGLVLQVAGTEIIDANSIQPYSDDYPILSFYMRYMLWFNLFFSVSTGIALYVKHRSGGLQGSGGGL